MIIFVILNIYSRNIKKNRKKPCREYGVELLPYEDPQTIAVLGISAISLDGRGKFPFISKLSKLIKY